MTSPISWRGVFPAITTQFDSSGAIDVPAIARIVGALIDDGVNGVIACGSVGENTALTPTEKRDVIAAIRQAAAGRVPVLAGLAELTTSDAVAFARDAAALGVDGLMVMPPMVYTAQIHEILAWFRAIAAASDAPIMLYNNPPAYRTDLTPALVARMTDIDTIVAVKESSGDTRRFVDLANQVGDRFVLFCGLDDVVLESLALGAQGWVSGLSNVFPRECARLFALGQAGRAAEALAIYRWIMPLLHFDARPDLVQCIKLCEEIVGRGTAQTRPPRLALADAERRMVETAMATALAQRPEV
ncbi:MAG: dihydrodipicolinate synthase family protein [Azospirillaceae bacterium]|nr:dihydrodipicolinate synthase family protein [Azospirillaceae bacterium]